MRGQTPVELAVPYAGWRGDMPIHHMPPNSMLSVPPRFNSYNVFIDVDGLIKPRLGYEVLHRFAGRVMGGYSWTSNVGTVQIIVAVLQSGQQLLYAWNGQTFVSIPGGPVVQGDERDPTRFVVLGFGADPANTNLFGKQLVFSCNGQDQGKMIVWPLTSPPSAYENAQSGGSPVGPFSARDIAVIADRIVAINVNDTDGPQPQRVRWSDVENGTIWHALAYDNLYDGDLGNLLAIRPTSRTSGIIYAERGQWIITAQLGSNAAAFSFDRLQGAEDGPVAGGPFTPAAVIDIAGRHYMVTTDQHISVCDGQTPRSISAYIDAWLTSSSQGIVANPDLQQPVTLYDRCRQKVWFFFNTPGDATQPAPLRGAYHAACLDLQRQIWEPPHIFPDPITAAFSLVEQMGPTWDNPGIYAQTTLAADAQPTDTTIQLTDASQFTKAPSGATDIIPQPVLPWSKPQSRDRMVGGVFAIEGEQIWYESIQKKAGGWIAVNCTRGALSPVYPPQQNTAPAFHAAGSAVVQYYSWETAPWKWEDIPASFEPAMYIGMANGLLCRFFKAFRDRAPYAGENLVLGIVSQPIPWSVTWALINPGPMNELKCNAIDLYISPGASPLNPQAVDRFTFTLDGLSTPYDLFPVNIVQQDAFSNDKKTWWIEPSKALYAGANIPSNYLRAALSGMSYFNEPWIAGLTLYVYQNQRQSPGATYGP